MELSYYEKNQTIIVKLEGDLNSESSEIFKQFILQLASKGHKKIILDCKQLKHVSSAGVQTLAVLLATPEMQTIKVAACYLSNNVSKIFALTNLNKSIPIFDEIKQAIEALNS